MEVIVENKHRDKKESCSKSDGLTDSLIRSNPCPKCEGLKPPDGGWGWVVVAASSYVGVTLVGLVMSFGVIFRDPLVEMGVSSTIIAWIMNSHSGLWHLASIFCGPVCENFGWRPVAFIGYTITAIAFMLLTFAKTPLMIFILFSVIIGIAGGISNMIVFLIVPAYFDKFRGTATALMMSGVGVGLASVPPLVRFLSDEYGFQGCALIFGAILANCCVSAMFFHPLEWHQSNKRSLYQKVNCSPNCPKELFKQKTPSAVKRIFKSTFLHLKQMRQYRMLLICSSFASFLIAYGNFLAQVPFAIEASGHGQKIPAYALSSSAITSTFFRIVVSVISDRKWFSRKLCYLSGMVITGSSCLVLTSSLDNVWLIFPCMMMSGAGTGFIFCTFHILLMDTCGRELYVSGLCIYEFFIAFFSLSTGHIYGLIRDYSSYTYSINSCGLVIILCACSWVLMPCAIEKDRAREKANRSF